MLSGNGRGFKRSHEVARVGDNWQHPKSEVDCFQGAECEGKSFATSKRSPFPGNCDQSAIKQTGGI